MLMKDLSSATSPVHFSHDLHFRKIFELIWTTLFSSKLRISHKKMAFSDKHMKNIYNMVICECKLAQKLISRLIKIRVYTSETKCTLTKFMITLRMLMK